MIYNLWLHSVAIASKDKHQLLEQFKDAKAIFDLSEEQLRAIGCTQNQQEKLIGAKRNLPEIEKQYHQMKEEGIEVIFLDEANYPKRLAQIDNPPLVLFAKGDSSILHKNTLAIVGSRKCSEYGFETAKKIAYDLTEYDMVIASGMARGIDEAGHKGCLEKGQTIAVLGTGVNVCYPKQNSGLYQQILEKGCIVSEYFPNTTAKPYQFPERNRIISGLSLGTIIVEAEARSGSLITAQLALEQGREVFAVPGNIYSALSQGTNGLIQEGAKLIQSAEDVLQEIICQIEGLK